jgi:hypothetical protein
LDHFQIFDLYVVAARDAVRRAGSPLRSDRSKQSDNKVSVNAA